MSFENEPTKLADILAANRALAPEDGRTYDMAVLTNVSLGAFPEILEYFLRVEKVPARVTVGEYNNIVQDAARFAAYRSVVIFWEASNILEGLHSNIEAWDEARIQELFQVVLAQLETLFATLANAGLVILNKFSSLLFDSEFIRKSQFRNFCDSLNEYVEVHAPKNFLIIDVDKVIARVGVTQSFDERFFYSAKAPFTISFFREYSAYVRPAFLAANGLSKKILVLDCDNTLWNGIVGEDGMDEIEMSEETSKGSPYAHVQALALSLQRDGVLLALCSKNNAVDVDEVLTSSRDMKIRDQHLTIKRVNWEDKVENIKDIARVLNLGVDSILFVDDSNFEIESVNQALPEVGTFRVPEKAYSYARAFRRQMQRFFVINRALEDSARTELYKAEAERSDAVKQYLNMDDYLASLGLLVEVQSGFGVSLERIAQLSQKTNQFNLTTTRYGVGELKSLLESEGGVIFSISLADRFGPYGVIGVAIITIDGSKSDLNTFLMSCRALGRRVEFAFFDYLVATLATRGFQELTARYVPTKKNSPISGFLDSIGFEPIQTVDPASFSYRLILNKYQPSNIDYIKVSHVD